MMLSEFEKLTGLEVTTAEYEKIEAECLLQCQRRAV